MKRKLFLFLLVGLAFFLAGLQPAQATPVIFELNYEYSGGTPPEGPSPWLRATFDPSPDNDDHVRLTMEAINLTDHEYIAEWSFNIGYYLDPSIPLDAVADMLDYIPIDTADIGGDNGITFSSGQNFYKAGPDGYFDLRFQFPSANNDNGIKRFIQGESVVVDLFLDLGESEGLFELTPLDFNFLSEPGNESADKGPYLSAAHIRAIGPEDDLSGWIAPSAVPESSTLLLLGIGLIGVAGLGRKRIKS